MIGTAITKVTRARIRARGLFGDIKARAARLAFVAAGSALLFLTSCGPPATNNGKESGYYGDFNRASNALVAIPGIRITNFWLNPDITLEEFGFDVVTQIGQPVHIAFGERDPRRKLSRVQLSAALAAEIKQRTQKTNP
jgi:hypothetical protein